ncbi:MAG: cytochrome C [Ignavibacteriae bacterium HGW-Ignavibacteriae-3]|nr:MAG: cytochrome C [Ignavibacteriae bacterium HGW-Ignavibacteriae-3]
MKLKLPHSSQNWISLIGATIALISLFMIIFLFVITFSSGGGTYLGLVVYIILPGFLVAGLVMIPIGMFLKVKRDKKHHILPPREWPHVNLNDLRHRHAFYIFSIGTTIFLFLTAFGSYEAFHYTESVEFCGKLCHSVMAPEYIAYQNSPHAKVACVACHVGEGADWYVRSKLSGLYQVYAVTLGTVPRPIETPISNLRPARETCEQCHWPQKFYSRNIVTQRHYLTDEKNSEWDISLTMKIGSLISAFGTTEGIHWHINPDIKIEYKSTDKKREKIPWVRYTNLKTGEIQIYQDINESVDKKSLDTMMTRTMDCMDCHNRPSHNYQPPSFFINTALASGTIPKDLPWVKAQALELVGKKYSTTDTAMIAIRDGINTYYKENYPEIYSKKKNIIDQAVKGIQDEFKKNIFPEMKVRWDVYPNNIGHFEFLGCFRCHTDNHSTDKGRLIKKDCNQCHYINAQGPPANLEVSSINSFLVFKHPDKDSGDAWKEMNCSDCHTGLNP